MDKTDLAIILCLAATTLALVAASIDLDSSDNSFMASAIRYLL